jgi:hypothetical protein
MTDEMEKLIDSYYEDSIELSDDKLLCFQRISNYRCTDRRAVKVSIEDLETRTKIDLATYFDAKWIFCSPMHESMFWQQVKSNSPEFKEVFDRMRVNVPIKELHVYQIKFGQMSDRVSNRMDKLTTIFKG